MRVDQRACTLALAVLVAASACRRDDPIAGSLIEDADARKEVRSGRRDPAAAAAPRSVYTKREGLHIDLPYLCGRRLADLAPDVLAEQLGVELRREAVNAGEERVEYERAEVWVLDGEVYRIRQALAHPMDIPTALGVSGFPLDLGPPIEGARELRWNRVWGLRRLRLERSPDDPRLYTHIDAWWRLPRELR